MIRHALTLSLVLVSTLFAQSPAPSPAPEAAAKFAPPAPSEEMEQMRKWEGQWKTVATFAKGGVMTDGGEMQGSYSAARGLNGHAYFGDYSAKGTMGEFKGHMVREFDPISRKWKTWWFDSWVPGNADLSIGEVGPDGVFVTTSESENQGTKFKMRITERWPDDNKVDQVYESDSGAGWTPVMSITYTRKGKWKEKKKPSDSSKDEKSGKKKKKKEEPKAEEKKAEAPKDDGPDEN